MNRPPHLFGITAITFATILAVFSMYARADITPSRVLVSALETNASSDPNLQTKNTCVVDEFGFLLTNRITGFSENGAPIRMERAATTISIELLNQLKIDLARASLGRMDESAPVCDKGTIVIQGQSLRGEEVFDLFAIRDCTHTITNTKREAVKIMNQMRDWCGMKLEAPILIPADPMRVMNQSSF